MLDVKPEAPRILLCLILYFIKKLGKPQTVLLINRAVNNFIFFSLQHSTDFNQRIKLIIKRIY